jgi:DNA repair exonuclease SbcCD ATPase subunit
MSATAKIHPFFFDEDGKDDLNIQFDPKQFEAVTPYSENLDDEYQQAQDQLRALRQQEEQIKRQAAELEELTKKEQQFKSGRIGVCEELSRHLNHLEREAAEALRIAEECNNAHELLESHLANINRLRPEMWSRADRKTELTRAIGYIEAAEDEIDKLLPVINGSSQKTGLFKSKAGPRLLSSLPSAFRGDFIYWLKSGFAFSLPFVGFGVIALIGFLLF